jgi:hypothetical protein
MTRRLAIVLMICAAALAMPVLAGAQTTDFTGKWVQDMEKSDPMGGGRAGGGGGGRGPAGPQTITITQTATELTIERETQAGVQKTVYKLDGTESVNAGGRGGEVKSTSKWDGAKLVTKSSRSMTNQAGEAMTIETEEVRSLEADGTMLVVTTTKSQMGEQTRKTVFKKG